MRTIDSIRSFWLLACVVGLSALVPLALASSEPYVPADPQLVVERLPKMPMRSVPDVKPAPPIRSIQKARDDALTYLTLAQRSGDTRYLGYAEGVLASWRTGGALPAALLLPQAIGEQARHDFAAALDTLDKLLRERPGDAQAWLTRSVILQVMGQPAAALQACRPLAGRVSHLVLTTCVASANRYTVEAPRAYRVLHHAIADASVADREVAAWSLSVLADLAESTGDMAAATEALESALQLDPEDARLRIAYADFLLRQGDASEVFEIIAHDSTGPMLLLRRALAAKALGMPELDRLRALLQLHFDAAARRGDGLHEREAALADLHLFDRPVRALELAQHNWQGQREFADTELVLAAALANARPEAARPAIRWLREQGNQDVRLATLIDRLMEQGAGHAF